MHRYVFDWLTDLQMYLPLRYRRYATRILLILCGLFILLLGSLLACAAGSSDSQRETATPYGHRTLANDSSVPTQPAAIASLAADPALPRGFAFLLPLFAAGSAWNQTAVSAQVLSASDDQILVTYRVLLGDDSDLSTGTTTPYWPFMYINYDEYSMPVFRAGAGQQSVLLCDYGGYKSWPSPKFPDPPQEGGPVTVSISAGTVRPAGPEGTDADGHLVLYDPDTSQAYDFWQATTVRDGECQSQGGGLEGTILYEAGAVDSFDVQGSGANPDTYSSARAMGTPLLAGLLLPEDVESGAISHALAFAIPGPRNLSDDPSEPLPSDYYYPASTTETDFYSTNPHALAAGQRIRLKQTIVNEEGNTINENNLAPITQMFLTTLRTYGAYLVDNSGAFSFYAEDIHSADLHLSDDQVNTLIDQLSGTPLPTNKTKWEIVIEKLNKELEQIPFAYGSGTHNPPAAQVEIANFEVVEPVTRAVTYTPLILRNFAAPVSSNLSAVDDFVYQLQNLNLSAIGDSAYDLVVMDYSADGSDDTAFSAAEIAALQHSPGGDKIVLAYMSIGEAENYCFYWDKSWDANGDGQPDPAAPGWLDVENPDWGGNYKVHYWDPAWQSIVFNYTGRLLDAGFDGAYLDIIDAYEYYIDQRPTAVQEMADFVAAIRAYARARNPGFYIFPQNASELADEVAGYVDGIGQEDIYYGYDDDDVMTPPAVSAELEGYLDLFKAAGKLVLTVDYATTREHVDDAYAKSGAKGYVPFCTVRDLDQLTVNPGHEPD